MLASLGLPSPDDEVLLGIVLFAGALGLAALWVWRRDRRALRRREAAAERDAVPRPIAEPDTAPCHLPDEIDPRPHPKNSPSQPPRAAAVNVKGRGHENNGAIARRLWRTVAEVARVLPPHSFRVEVLLDCRGLSVEEPAFSLALAALLLHAAQLGRSHLIELAPLAPEHPLYRRSASPQLIVHVTSEPEQPGLPSYLADQAIDLCRLAGGAGSVEVDSNLWLIWPTSPQPAGAGVQAPSAAAQTPAICA
ncbi:MAG: hypothetical protein U1A78_19045 [Polyangia bacterium]